MSMLKKFCADILKRFLRKSQKIARWKPLLMPAECMVIQRVITKEYVFWKCCGSGGEIRASQYERSVKTVHVFYVLYVYLNKYCRVCRRTFSLYTSVIASQYSVSYLKWNSIRKMFAPLPGLLLHSVYAEYFSIYMRCCCTQWAKRCEHFNGKQYEMVDYICYGVSRRKWVEEYISWYNLFVDVLNNIASKILNIYSSLNEL